MIWFTAPVSAGTLEQKYGNFGRNRDFLLTAGEKRDTIDSVEVFTRGGSGRDSDTGPSFVT